MKIPEGFAPYDSADYIRDADDAAAYLEACFDEAGDDAAFIAHALGVVTRVALAGALEILRAVHAIRGSGGVKQPVQVVGQEYGRSHGYECNTVIPSPTHGSRTTTAPTNRHFGLAPQSCTQPTTTPPSMARPCFPLRELHVWLSHSLRAWSQDRSPLVARIQVTPDLRDS